MAWITFTILYNQHHYQKLLQMDFPGGSVVKNPLASACQCRRCRFDPWVRKTPGEGNGNPLQYSCLENPQGQRSLVGYIQSMALQGVGHNWASHTQGHYRLTWSITWVWGLDSQFLERERMSLPAEPQGAGALGQPRGIEWGGRSVQDGEHMYTCGGFILIFGKTNTIM